MKSHRSNNLKLTYILKIGDIGMSFLHVPQQIAFANERFAALTATERFFTGVRATMRYQMTFRYEIFGAQITTEWSFGFDAFVVTALMEQ